MLINHTLCDEPRFWIEFPSSKKERALQVIKLLQELGIYILNSGDCSVFDVQSADGAPTGKSAFIVEPSYHDDVTRFSAKEIVKTLSD